MRWLLGCGSLLAVTVALADGAPPSPPGKAPGPPAGVAAAAEEEVRKAERAFAKAFADRDQAAFFAFVLDDAHFLGPGGTLSGRDQVKEVWSRFFAEKTAPFAWEPRRVHANAAGDLALSMGPITAKDGQPLGQYVSIWRRQQDGSWKVAFDGPGLPPPCPAAEDPKKK